MQKKILLVEDDLAIAEMVVEHIQKEGITIIHAINGEEALQLFATDTFDMILLDLMLPGLTGMDFLERIRKKSFIPILILSAKNSEVDKALGLGLGADDYLAKPFSLIELSARIKAMLRRSLQYSEPIQQTVHIHELTLDHTNLQVSKQGKEIKLTSKEFQILQLLMTNPKRAFSKEQIYQSVWNDHYYGDVNAIQVHISRIREKIEDNPTEPKYIKTVWGIGYKLGDF